MIKSKNNKPNASEFELISNAPLSGNLKDDDNYIKLAKILEKTIDSDDGNYNIGVIGAFGTGKSSLLEMYKRKNRRHKIVSVSLADFSNSESVKKPEEKREDEKYLESIIIQQILYSRKKYQLPASRIKRIGIRIRSIILVISAILTVSSFLVSKYIKFPNSCCWNKIFFWSGIIFSFITFVAFLISFPIVTIAASFKGVQIASEPNIEATLFDEYLDELIYFFKKTKTNVVIFEDIDRCENDEIFSRLRSLNFTLNNSSYFKNRKIHFIYAVKEDLFISSETKSKFFDVLISLPPLLSRDNSYYHVLRVLEGNGINCLKTEFVKGVSLYIDSYRQINNIVNDYLIFSKVKYNDTLKSDDSHKLFLMLVYKSKFPADYVKFTLGEGFLWSLIENKRIEITSDKKISDFYLTFKEYLNESCLSLVSYFVPGSYESDEERLFYSHIEFNSMYFDPDTVYKNPEYILSNKNVESYIKSTGFLNVSIINTLFIQSNDSLKNKFFESFTDNNAKRAEFIDYMVKNIVNNEDLAFELFRGVSHHYLSLLNRIAKTDMFDNPIYAKRFFKQSLCDKSDIEKQNTSGDLQRILNNSLYSDEILCNMNDECFNYSLNLITSIQRIDLEEYFKNDEPYKEKGEKIVLSNKFLKTFDNYYSAAIILCNRKSKLDERFPLLARLVDVLENEGIYKTVADGCIKFFNEQYNNENNRFGSNYELCTNEQLIVLFKKFSNVQITDDIIANINYLEIYKADDVPIVVLLRLFKARKLKAPISIWNAILKSDNTLENSIVELITNDFEQFLSIETNKNQSYFELLYAILNNEKIDYSSAGKILELCVDVKSLDLLSIKNEESQRCAIDYVYGVYKTSDINNITFDLLTSYFNSYYNDIVADGTLISLEEKRVAKLLIDIEDKDKILAIIKKYINKVSKPIAIVQNHAEVFDKYFSEINTNLIEEYLLLDEISPNNKVSLLMHHFDSLSDGVLMSFINISKAANLSDKFADTTILDEFKKRVKKITANQFTIRIKNGYFSFVKNNRKVQ